MIRRLLLLPSSSSGVLLVLLFLNLLPAPGLCFLSKGPPRTPGHRRALALLRGASSDKDEAEERGWRAVETEVKILLKKIADANRVMSLKPEEEATQVLTEYLDKLIDQRGSPIPLSTLADDDFCAGQWRLAFTTDPRATFFGNPLVGGSTVVLDISPRRVVTGTLPLATAGGGTAAAAVPAPTNTGVLEQRISVGGKPGLRGEATYRIDPATGYFSYDFDAIWANLFGREIAVPGFVVERSASYIDAKYFDGRLWVERFYAEGPEGPSSNDLIAYNCWQREG
jgi:hypothetical protein